MGDHLQHQSLGPGAETKWFSQKAVEDVNAVILLNLLLPVVVTFLKGKQNLLHFKSSQICSSIVQYRVFI